MRLCRCPFRALVEIRRSNACRYGRGINKLCVSSISSIINLVNATANVLQMYSLCPNSQVHYGTLLADHCTAFWSSPPYGCPRMPDRPRHTHCALSMLSRSRSARLRLRVCALFLSLSSCPDSKSLPQPRRQTSSFLLLLLLLSRRFSRTAIGPIAPLLSKSSKCSDPIFSSTRRN